MSSHQLVVRKAGYTRPSKKCHRGGHRLVFPQLNLGFLSQVAPNQLANLSPKPGLKLNQFTTSLPLPLPGGSGHCPWCACINQKWCKHVGVVLMSLPVAACILAHDEGRLALRSK